MANTHLSIYPLIRPILFRLPPESAHNFAISSLTSAFRIRPVRAFLERRYRTDPWQLNRFGLKFTNPVGLAAGFDKNGVAAHALAALGFGFIEVGTVTSEPQRGNPKPRLFRLPSDRALINRLGFNNCSAQQLAENLKHHRPDCVVGVNIGKSRSVEMDDTIRDYLASFAAVYDVADYIAVNVSSPNTPGVRQLQHAALLEDLLSSLQEKNRALAESRSQTPRPLLVKIAPDLVESQIEALIDVALREGISGIIATNTTTERDGLLTPANEVAAYGDGGLSGAPLRNRSTQVISFIHRSTRGALPIIGVGGIFTAQDAWEKICSGASLVQLYTGFIYEGPGVAHHINEGLLELMKREGFDSLDQAVGSGA